ncbi:5635_t:CDS:2, partial [Funneliformis geosporum]
MKYDEIKIGDDDTNDNDEFWTVDDDIEEDDNIEKVDDINDWWDCNKPYTRYDYITHFKREVKDKLFNTFSKFTAFRIIEYNMLLETLSDLRK